MQQNGQIRYHTNKIDLSRRSKTINKTISNLAITCQEAMKVLQVLPIHPPYSSYNENHVDMLPLGSDVTDMVHLEHLNAYLMIEGFMNVWSFPTNNVQNKMSKAIRRREKMMTMTARASSVTL